LFSDENEILGSGRFGVVFKGQIKITGQEIAVKTTYPNSMNLFIKSLAQELKILTYLRGHQNIVNLVGAHTSRLNEGALSPTYLNTTGIKLKKLNIY